MKTLTDIQKNLRDILPEGIDLTIQGLKNFLSDKTDKYKDLILLESRYMEVMRQMLQNVVSNEEAQIELSKIRKDLLTFIDSLQESHLKGEDGAENSDRPDIYNGEVMYRIPKKMKQAEEVKCIVRLAFDRKVLMDDLKEEEGDVLKDLRISEVMGVELIDAGEGAFKIRTLNDTVQMVEKDLYTEWLFYVTPQLPGTHPLVLKISVIEIKDGVERKRNVVLEEKVEILTTQPVGAETAEFTRAGYSLSLASGNAMAQMPGGVKGVEPSPSAPSPPSPSIPAKPRSGNIRRMASALAGVVALFVATWAIWGSLNTNNGAITTDPGEKTLAWEDAKSMNTREGYEEFIMENPESPHVAAARNELAAIETDTWNQALAMNSADAIHAYLDAYPEGRYKTEAMAMLAEMGNPIKTTPDPMPEDPPVPAKPETTNRKKPADKKPGDKKTEQKPETQSDPKITKDDPAGPATGGNDPKPKDVDPPVVKESAYRLPVHQGCEDKDKRKEERCTDGKISKHVKRFLNYPDEARKKRIEGLVTVEFIVERDGSVTNVRAKNDIGGGCAEEAVRIIKKLVRFKPGQSRDGHPIRVLYSVPIRFKLN